MAPKPVEFHEEATTEAEAAVTWYRERSPRAEALTVTGCDSHLEPAQINVGFTSR